LTCGRCVIALLATSLCSTPIEKVTICRSQRSRLESDDFLKSVMPTDPLDPLDSVSTEFNIPIPDDPLNIIIIRRPRELLKVNWLLTAHAPLAASRHTAVRTYLFEYGTSKSLVSTGLDLLSTPKLGVQDSFAISFQQTPEKSKKDFQDSIWVFLNDCRPAMETLVSKAGDIPSFMPSWKPSTSMDSRLSDHIRQLDIPRDKGGLPSLLLHDLGEEKSDLDRVRASHIPGIFSNTNTCVVHVVMVHFHISCVLGYSLTHLDPGRLEFSLKAYVGTGDSTLWRSDHQL